jgi:hypothetical protein
MVHVLEDRDAGRREQRTLPERAVVVADEDLVEGEAREQRAHRQHGERHEHHPGTLVRRVVPVVAVLVVRVVGGLGVAAALVVLHALVVVVRDVDRRAVVGRRVRAPAGLALEGEEVEPPGVERGHEGGEHHAQEREGVAGAGEA